jgi:uncharacterized protein YecE (DUF72 family)
MQVVAAPSLAARGFPEEWPANHGGKRRAHHWQTAEERMAEIWIGTSGYVYRHWRSGVFYPAGLPARDELAWYAGRFRTVELNNPFYRPPSRETWSRWAAAVPDDFLFAVKVTRVVSHYRRLRGTAEPLARLLEDAGALGPKLGPLLVQLPPQFPLDQRTLEAFLAQLPSSRRWVLEVRHPSWQVPAVYKALAARDVALCVPVGGAIQPDLVTTAGFTYLRMHRGAGAGGGFGDEELTLWARRVRAVAGSGKEVYVYFNNDRDGHAPRDAARLRQLLKVVR